MYRSKNTNLGNIALFLLRKDCVQIAEGRGEKQRFTKKSLSTNCEVLVCHALSVRNRSKTKIVSCINVKQE